MITTGCSAKSNKKILALDFDGVICDSIHECLVVSHNAFMAYSGHRHQITNPDALETAQVQRFTALRHFIRTGEDYLFIHMAMQQGVDIQSQEAFDHFTLPHATNRSTFRACFYEARTRLFENHHAQWLRLNPLYPGVREALLKTPHLERILIISTKRDDFIKAILQGHGISFPAGQIFYASAGQTKREIIDQWLYTHHRPLHQFHFIDDQIDTLLTLQSLGVHCTLAGWGYNALPQRILASEHGIQVFSLETFLQSLLAFTEL